jgi:broad specificity phosphatase PhoE
VRHEQKRGKVVLVRHTAVAARYAGLCYGQSDVELSSLGQAQSLELATALARLPVARVIHSGLQRTKFLAEKLGVLLGIAPECSESVRERSFGAWELRDWEEIYRLTGDEMLRMVTEPATYRPGGGETTNEMRDRVVAFVNSLDETGVIVIVTHGGPIAAVAGTHQRLPLSEWLALIPPLGGTVTIEDKTNDVVVGSGWKAKLPDHSTHKYLKALMAPWRIIRAAPPAPPVRGPPGLLQEVRDLLGGATSSAAFCCLSVERFSGSSEWLTV